MTAGARVDHLVVIAHSLAQGAAWCKQVLGVDPAPGGEHPLMGTHNRVLRIATVDFPRAYLEIIAIDPGKSPEKGRRRWFDMDDEAIRRATREEPRLAHFVANVPDIAGALAAWRSLGIDRGEALQASRMTPRGLLEWKIAVRSDGQRLFDGCLPTLIEWGDVHPIASLPESGVTLHGLSLSHPRAPALARAVEAIGLSRVTAAQGEPNICATLITPKGRVRLESKGL